MGRPIMDKRNIIATLLDSELQDYQLIVTKRVTSEQALKLRLIPKDLRDDLKKAFYSAALENWQKAVFLEENWWASFKKRFEISADKNLRVDMITGEVYGL